jgi:hypothetical protein
MIGYSQQVGEMPTGGFLNYYLTLVCDTQTRMLVRDMIALFFQHQINAHHRC